MPQAAVGLDTPGNLSDVDYEQHVDEIRIRFLERSTNEHLFFVDTAGLFDLYIRSLPEHERQHSTCTCCRRFFEAFGGLVWISQAGVTESALWNESTAPPLYRDAIAAVRREVERRPVEGVFTTDRHDLGQRWTGQWQHYAVYVPPSRRNREKLKTAGQVMAERREEFGMVNRALADFTPDVVIAALGLLTSDALYRSEKVKGPVQWFHDLIVARGKTQNAKHRDNLVWRALALAPVGFAHLRSGMAGTLLEDLSSGMAFEDASRRFAAKMHPLQYQRPQAAPAAGNIKRGEETQRFPVLLQKSFTFQ